MDFVISIDLKAALPLYRQVYAQLRQAILSRRLTPGEKLPSTRTLAQLLSVSRATITQSYEMLLSEGYLETIVGSGTFVCRQLPDELLNTTPIQAKSQLPHSSISLSTYGESLSDRAFLHLPEAEVEISFSYGRPAFDQFPIDLWRKLLSRHCRFNQYVLDYTYDSMGYQPLREAIADYLSRSRAVKCEPEQIIIVGGSQQGLEQNLVHIFARAKWLADRQCSLLEQYALTDFITEGHLERHIRRMRALYDQRRQTLVRSLFSYFGDKIEISGENAGMHLMVKINTKLTDDKIVQLAALAGVNIGAAYPQYLKHSPGGEFILGYAELNEQKIQEGVRRLAQVILI